MNVMMPVPLTVTNSGAFAAGDLVKVSGNASNYVFGTVLSVVTDTSITVDYNYGVAGANIVGSGSFASFNISLVGATGPTGAAADWSTAQTVASFTTGNLTSASVGKLLYNTAACTLTLTSSTGFSVGQRVDLARLDAGTFTVAQGSGATLAGTPAYTLRAQYSAASIICTAANTYLIVGDLG
jgi:hypothetical protein